MTKRQQKIVDYCGYVFCFVLLVIVVAIAYSSSSRVKKRGVIKQAIIDTGREVKDIVHEIQKEGRKD